jgi:hypothetical protein
MMQRLHYLDSTVRKDESPYAAAESSPALQYNAETGRHCAYNQTRQRFLGADVSAGDFSITSLDNHLPTLALNSGAGLWLLPFRGISPTSVRVPVDLIYLGRGGAVIETVESFPISRVSATSAPAASVLVLPADTIRNTETQAGDQLILCAPEEMKQRLRQLAGAAADTKPEQTAASAVAPTRDASRATARVLQFEDRSRPRNAAEMVPAVDRTPELLPSLPAPSIPEASPDPQPAAEAAPEPKTAKPAKSWLQRLLSPDPPNPRKATRESVPGLAAYFFTGGAPVAHAVRDISPTGMYIFTNERWYPGTIVRMTITDRLESTAERSITLNTTVVRWGNDGVGLQFVLANPKDRRQGQSGGADRAQIDQFLQRLKVAKR